MNSKIKYMAILSASALFLAGCSTEREQKRRIEIYPAPCIITPDSINNAELDVKVSVPSHYFSKRSRLIIVPQLLDNETVSKEYRPLVIDAPIYTKKKERMEKLTGYRDPYAGANIERDKVSSAFVIPYHEEITLPEDITNGRIRALVTTDGCGECTGFDTLTVASVFNPASLLPRLDDSFVVEFMEPEFVIRPKVVRGKGTARLQFIINKYDINLKLGRNRTELDSMKNTLSKVLGDSLATLNSLSIYGMASADGSLPFNTTLSSNRAKSAKNWLVSELNIGARERRRIKVGSRPEGWYPVLDAMTADNNPDSAAVKAILDKYADQNDDVQERHIRRLPCWKDIAARYLQKDRKVEYEYTYTLKSFTTDAEMLEMYESRPDAFNEDELLRVSSLKKTDDEKMEVYATILKYFPQSVTAANNLSLLYLRKDDAGSARRLLETLNEHNDETISALALCMVSEGNLNDAEKLLRGCSGRMARRNLGLLLAHRHKYAEAYPLLVLDGGEEAAVCALGINKNMEADMIIKAVKERTPLTEYISALTSARTGNDEDFFKHLELCCKDESLKARAAAEADFFKYHFDERFRIITGYCK